MKVLQICGTEPSHDQITNCHWPFINTLIGKTQNNIGKRAIQTCFRRNMGHLHKKEPTGKTLLQRKAQWAGLSKKGLTALKLNACSKNG